MTIALPKHARIAVICSGVISASIAHVHCRLGVPLTAAAHGHPLTKPLNRMNPHIPVLEDSPTDTVVRQQGRRDERVVQKAADPFIGRPVPFPKADPAPILQSNKPILCHAKPVGYLCAGTFGPAFGGLAIPGIGVRSGGLTVDFLRSNRFGVEISDCRFAATPSLPTYNDPKGRHVQQ